MSPDRTIPSADAEPERYKGRPLLVLLENYVLDAIGELPEGKSAGLAQITQRVFGGGPDWRATLRETLHLPETLDQELRRLWARNRDIARQAKAELHPIQFAKMIADDNFKDLIDELPSAG